MLQRPRTAAPAAHRSRFGPLLAATLAASLLLAPAYADTEGESAPAADGAATAATVDTRSACEQVTPPDGPFACIEIIPPGASAWVTLDGVARGLSPLGLADLEPGPHTLRLDREGDAPLVERFILGPGEVRRFDLPLPTLPPAAPPAWPEWVYPLAVMVENHDDARPQAGLDLADVVYEALAEGGISRFLALYITREAEVIGPVRSTRHYFVYTAAEFNATLVHIGASPIGYAALSATAIRNVNESWGDGGVWRSPRRAAPHDAFTSTAEARAAADARTDGWPGSWGPLLFKDPAVPTQGVAASTIRLRYPGGYRVGYVYDPTVNAYARYMEGTPHLDHMTDAHLYAANVVVQVVPDEVIDREGRLDLAQTGVGTAYYFVDGTVIEGTWTKSDFGSQTFFWDTAGNLVRLNPGGTTWVQIVPSEASVSFE